MKYNEFEEHIKKQFSGSTEDVDTVSLINNLYKADVSKRRRKLLFLLLAISIFSVLTLVSSYKLVSSSNPDNKNNSPAALLTVDHQKGQKENNKSTYATKKAIETESTSQKEIKLLPNSYAVEHKLNPTKSISNDNKLQKTQSKDYSILKNEAKLNSYDFKTDNFEKTLIKPFHKIENKFSSAIAKTNSKMIDPKIIGGDIIKCPDFGKLGWYFDLIVEAGGYKPFKSLSHPGGEDDLLLSSRKDNEKPLENIHSAIGILMSRDKLPFYINTGISYSRTAERLELSHQYIEIDTIKGIISITQSQNGDTLTVIWGDKIKEDTFTTNQTKHYYMHMFDLYLGLGKNMYFGDFAIGMEAGAMLNVFNRASGKIQTRPGTVEDLKGLDMFRSSVGLGFYCDVKLIRSLNYNQSIYMSLKYKYYPSSFAGRNNNINQKYQLAGVNLGYVYRFQ